MQENSETLDFRIFWRSMPPDPPIIFRAFGARPPHFEKAFLA